MSEDNAFLDVPGLDPADAEDFAQVAHENFAAYQKTLDLQKLMNATAFGVPPDAIDGAISLGAQFVTQGLLQKGWDVFAGLQVIEPLNWRVMTWLGYIRLLQKEYWGALDLLNYARAFAPEEALPRFYLGECMLLLERPDMAVYELEWAIKYAQGQPKLQAQVKRAEQLVHAARERMQKVAHGK